jgi:hypothetical protein
MARTGADSMDVAVEATLVYTGISSMTFAMGTPKAHGWAVTMALVVGALMTYAGGGRIAIQVVSPMNNAEAVISMAAAMYASAIYAGADSHSRVMD